MQKWSVPRLIICGPPPGTDPVFDRWCETLDTQKKIRWLLAERGGHMAAEEGQVPVTAVEVSQGEGRERLGSVRMVVSVEIPIRSRWSKDYLFKRAQGTVQAMRDELVLLGGSVFYDVVQEDEKGLLVQRDCPTMVPGQEDDGNPE